RAAGEGAGEVVNRPAWRAALIGALVVLSVVGLLPTLVRPAPPWWPWEKTGPVGADLQGGAHPRYRIDIDPGLQNPGDGDMQDLERDLRDAQIGVSNIERRGRMIRLKIANPDRRQDVVALVKEHFGDELIQVEPEQGEDVDFVFTLPETVVRRLQETT